MTRRIFGATSAAAAAAAGRAREEPLCRRIWIDIRRTVNGGRGRPECTTCGHITYINPRRTEFRVDYQYTNVRVVINGKQKRARKTQDTMH